MQVFQAQNVVKKVSEISSVCQHVHCSYHIYISQPVFDITSLTLPSRVNAPEQIKTKHCSKYANLGLFTLFRSLPLTNSSLFNFRLSGRAIRHRGDYATILLLDQRYGSARIKRNLPGWISNRLQHHARFGSAFAAIRKVSYQGRVGSTESVRTNRLAASFSKQVLIHTPWRESFCIQPRF